jgi:hypothetical protein
MRHAIVVVGSEEQRGQAPPTICLRENEGVRMSTWYACANQDNPAHLLDDCKSGVQRVYLVPLLAYRFYLLVQNTRLWSGKRPLIVVRGRSLTSRVAAYAGSWGGGDVVLSAVEGETPLGPTRFILDDSGNLSIHGG